MTQHVHLCRHSKKCKMHVTCNLMHTNMHWHRRNRLHAMYTTKFPQTLKLCVLWQMQCYDMLVCDVHLGVTAYDKQAFASPLQAPCKPLASPLCPAASNAMQCNAMQCNAMQPAVLRQDGVSCMLHVVEAHTGHLNDASCQLSMFFT